MKRIGASRLLNPGRPFCLPPLWFAGMRKFTGKAYPSVFFKACQSTESKKSSLCSPFSLEQALVPAWMGSDGATRKILDSIYHPMERASHPQMSNIDPIDHYHQMNHRLTKSKTLAILNSMWIDKKRGFKLKDNFVKRIGNFSTIKCLDFDQQTQTVLDKWISDSTDQFIPKGPTIDFSDRNLRSLLINILYFNGTWQHKFKKAVLDDFKLPDGSTKKLPIMNNLLDSCNYVNDGSTSAIELPYEDDFSMIVAIDNNSLSVPHIDDMKLWELKETMLPEKVDVSMPKFSFETEQKLLKKLVSHTASSIIGPYNQIGNEKLIISDIIQKCKIEVDENGTKAAAVTVVTMRKGCAVIDRRQTIYFDARRSFAFFIINRHFEKLIFCGKYIGEQN